MSDRRCPYCGELVPSNSLTCPKCFKKIPVEPEPPLDDGAHDSSKGGRVHRQRRIALVLDAILGLFGLLGIGQLYLGRRRGAAFLIAGLVFFVPAAVLLFIVPFISTIFAIPLFVVYGLLYLAAIADVILGPLLFHAVR